jgi:hypothetical protein
MVYMEDNIVLEGPVQTFSRTWSKSSGIYIQVHYYTVPSVVLFCLEKIQLGGNNVQPTHVAAFSYRIFHYWSLPTLS